MKHANPIIRKFKSLHWVLIMMCATLLNPNQQTQCLTASSVRARERQSRAPKKGILGVFCRGPYQTRVTVYPYNRYTRGTNPVARHVLSLTWAAQRMRTHQRAPKRAATQPSHDSNTRAQAPNLVASYKLSVEAPTGIMLPLNATTDTLEVQILSRDMCCH